MQYFHIVCRLEIVPPESTIVFRSEVQATVSLSETFPCQRVNGIFRKLQSLGRFAINNTSTVELSNTSKALNEFENAISAYTRLTKFKHLSNALELIVNKDGKKREQDIFDSHVAKLSPVQQTYVQEWRELYNRTKHADRNDSDIETYKSGIKHLGRKYLIPIRKCYQNIVLSISRFFFYLSNLTTLDMYSEVKTYEISMLRRFELHSSQLLLYNLSLTPKR